MPLASGTRLGSYEIVTPLGAGGMGEVYRARDSKLKREVALKVLPADVANDRERLARFQREAEVLASLNHPNIAHIHGLEENALVMELVEGEDLAQRIARGPIPIDEALPIAKQIAEALEAAHEQAIIHRDLKPANIKVRADGTVKVLDFGLAKAMAGSTGSESFINSPTITSPAHLRQGDGREAMTEVGAMLGTAAYMSPEQAKGKAVDKRADIWAFGCVLYEMLTGRRAFGGDDIADILTAIMRDTPEWTTLPTGTPPGVRHVLRRCLERDVRNRLHDIADARIEIGDQIHKTDADAPTAPQLTRGPRFFAIAGWLLAIAMAGFMLWARPGRETTPASRTAYRFTIPQPGGNSSAPAISPNGRYIAYATAGDVAINSIEGVGLIQVRALDEAAPRVLAGTEGAREPFWSPDSRTIAFFTADGLKRVSVTGGQVERLAALPRGWPAGSWSSNGTILVEITENPEGEGWYVLSAGASVLRKIRAFPENRPTNPDKAFPTFLPDGDHFLFTHPVGETPTVQVGSVSSADTRALVMSDTRPFYAAPGFLFYLRDGTLFAQRFDANTLTTAGEPAAIADNVDFFAATGEASVSVSQEGTLVIRRWPGKSALQWFDRKGQPGSRVLDPNYYEGGAISPDGQRLLIGIADPRRSSQDLWVIDLERNVSTRLTSSPRSEWAGHWAPDGNRIVFSADWNGPPNLYVSDATTVAPKVLVPFDRTQQYAGGWTPDGRQVLYAKYNERYNTDVWAIDVSSGERRVVLATEFNEETPTPSPNGQWLASVSNASGREEVYLRAFPGGEWQLRLSTDGGRDPVWRRDGKEIFYYQPGGAIMAVTIEAQTGGRVRAGVPTRLFAVEGRLYRSFTVAPDGQRILLNLADPAGLLPPDEVIVDWTRLITR